MTHTINTHINNTTAADKHGLHRYAERFIDDDGWDVAEWEHSNYGTDMCQDDYQDVLEEIQELVARHGMEYLPHIKSQDGQRNNYRVTNELVICVTNGVLKTVKIASLIKGL